MLTSTYDVNSPMPNFSHTFDLQLSIYTFVVLLVYYFVHCIYSKVVSVFIFHNIS